MADRNYPQLPTTVWRGVRQILRKSPRRKLDDQVLAVELGVQQTAAKAYLNQLISLGLFKEDGIPTDLADRWRQDDPEVALQEILKRAYPETLLDLAPVDNLDRQKIVRWFTGQGLGEGTAGNKAATYIMISQASSGESDTATSTVSKPRPPTEKTAKSNRNQNLSPSTRSRGPSNLVDKQEGAQSERKQTQPSLNVNIQIHISADASGDQIDAIFSSMKRYFDDPASDK